MFFRLPKQLYVTDMLDVSSLTRGAQSYRSLFYLKYRIRFLAQNEKKSDESGTEERERSEFVKNV